VAPVIDAADLAICHLETPVAPLEGPFEGYPTFAVQPQIVDALTGAGYDTCSTASNHSSMPASPDWSAPWTPSTPAAWATPAPTAPHRRPRPRT
jgi:poly-gamma-glutamate capsule biosynthesis protein CapA/YwtB (metallophosphatase superfamily)